MSILSKARDQLQELRQLGAGGTLFRLGWEARTRLGLAALVESPPRIDFEPPAGWAAGIPFALPESVRHSVSGRIPTAALERLLATADDACQGRILAFGRWPADYGSPPDWHVNPESGARWNPGLHWSRAIRDGSRVGDIKLTWEIGRFPHAYHLARAAALEVGSTRQYADALGSQIGSFVRCNPYAKGVHWGSGQEIAFRLLAWHFATPALFRGPDFAATRQVLAASTLEGAFYLADHIEYARRAVHNNHLLSEALGLYLAGSLFPDFSESARWRRFGRALLEEHVPRQFYRDGGYIQQSHNYHRLALQVVLCAVMITRARKEVVPAVWLTSLSQSVDFLVAQQNNADGRLPNYGANDGGLPLVLSTCDYSDFRPTLQAASLASRGERIYPEGPWDEEAAWLLGSDVLDSSLRRPDRVSVSFPDTGFHVLRGRDSDNFAVLRCGTIKDRFSQIDMLHLDLWWKGVNVLVDPGSYLYNGPAEWHNHFLRTASHNTLSIDGYDQMVHFRPFKCLYPTRARVVRFEDGPLWSLCEGEHFGYVRYPGSPVHRRTVLFLKDSILVVADQVTGEGDHSARIHWLCDAAVLPSAREVRSLEIQVPDGMLSLRVFGSAGELLAQDVAVGQTDPPRGWLSRYYGRKTPCISSSVTLQDRVPVTIVSIVGSADATVSQNNGEWLILNKGICCRFRVDPSGVSGVVVGQAAPR